MYALARRLTIPLAAWVAALACATTAGRSSPAPRTHAVVSDRDVTAQQLAAITTDQSLYDALAGLRPTFLSFRGQSPTVYVDGVYAGPLAKLRELPVRWVQHVRLLTSTEATSLPGANGSAPALLVTMRRDS